MALKIVPSMIRAMCIHAAFLGLALPASGQEGQPTSTTVNGRTIIHDAEQIAIIRGEHPRLLGHWPQYGLLDTALRKNVIITDVIGPESRWEKWDGSTMTTHGAGAMSGGDHTLHNHYQNLLCETWNFARNANAVSIWGDSMAAADGAKAWGAFFSARSHCQSFTGAGFSRYAPPGTDLGCGPGFDAHLIGIEVDVLNSGQPGTHDHLAKTGVQIVGFGKPNTMAIEVLCEDSGAPSGTARRGEWNIGMCVSNCLTETGRLLVANFERAAVGLDFRRAIFSGGALSMRTEGPGTGIVCNEGMSGELYGGPLRAGKPEDGYWMTLRAGNGGLRLTNHESTRDLIAVDNRGAIHLNGDVYVNQRRLDAAGLGPSAWRTRFDDRAWLWIVGTLGVLVLWLIQKIIRMQIRMRRLMRAVGLDHAGRPVARAAV